MTIIYIEPRPISKILSDTEVYTKRTNKLISASLKINEKAVASDLPENSKAALNSIHLSNLATTAFAKIHQDPILPSERISYNQEAFESLYLYNPDQEANTINIFNPFLQLNYTKELSQISLSSYETLSNFIATNKYIGRYANIISSPEPSLIPFPEPILILYQTKYAYYAIINPQSNPSFRILGPDYLTCQWQLSANQDFSYQNQADLEELIIQNANLHNQVR